MSRRRISSRTALKAAGLLLLIGLAAIVIWRGSKDDFSYFHEQAKKLGFDRERIIAFVNDDVAALDVESSHRGALGALWGKTGSSLDRALLLQALLAEAELEAELIGADGNCGVRLVETGELIGIDSQASDKWEPIQAKPDFSIRFSGTNEKNEFEGRVADFLRSPLRVSVDGNIARVINRMGEVLWEGSYDLAEGFSMHLSFPVEGAKPVRVWRELVPKDCSEKVSSEHAVVFAPCEIDHAVFKKQVELHADEKSWNDGLVDAYQLALAHWYQSDQALVDLRSFHEAEAYYRLPRVLIGSVYQADNERLGYALDLRKNDIHVVGNEQSKLAFNLTRSAIEANLEAKVLTEATGRRGISGIDVFLAQMGDWAPSSPRRISEYEETLGSFLAETNPGSELTFSVGEGLEIKLVRHDGENALGLNLSKALESKRKEISELPWEVIKSGKASRDQLPLLAMEMEALLGAASEVGFDYEPGIEIGHSPALIKSPHVRRFTYRYDKETDNGRLAFEQQVTQIHEDGSYSYTVIDYWDEIHEKWQVNSWDYTVPAETYRNATGISQWHINHLIQQGCSTYTLGLKAYTELKEKGSTVMVGYLNSGAKTEPIRFFLSDEQSIGVRINQKQVKVPVLRIAGRPVRENPKKTKWEDTELMDDPATPHPDGFNRFMVLDDPEFPMIIAYGEFIQAAVSGKVLAEGGNGPVRDARIRIPQAGVSAKTWPTGDFVLPIIKKPFDEFEVSIEHPDYEPWVETLDFRSLDAFEKLKNIRLKPRPRTDRFTWIQPESIDQDLARVADENVKRFVRQSLTDNPSLQALVPLQDVQIGYGSTIAWLLVDRSSGHLTAVTSNGLHGAVDMSMGNLGALGALGKSTGLKAQYGGVMSTYSGFISSWYAYSAGKLEALTIAMEGGDFSDLGHAHAKTFALRFLERMMSSTDNIFAKQAGVNGAAYKVGFLKGLEFFDNHPEYRGQ